MFIFKIPLIFSITREKYLYFINKSIVQVLFVFTFEQKILKLISYQEQFLKWLYIYFFYRGKKVTVPSKV